jgi:hypothetical protein
VGAWSLEFFWNLDVGIWMFEIRMFELGISVSETSLPASLGRTLGAAQHSFFRNPARHWAGAARTGQGRHAGASFLRLAFRRADYF